MPKKILKIKLLFFLTLISIVLIFFYLIGKHHQNQKFYNIVEGILIENLNLLEEHPYDFQSIFKALVLSNPEILELEIQDAQSKNSIYKFENPVFKKYFYSYKIEKTLNAKNGKQAILRIGYKFDYKELLIFLMIVFLGFLGAYLGLNKILKKIQKLTFQRKADFYLIYQLFEPFLKFQIRSTYFKVYTILQQLDSFKFNKTKFRIGGDYIYLKEIFLRNRRYLFFINADAMGKSLQGIGGIIVLSSILSAILKRTEKIKTEQQKYPETWLKYTSIEIQEVLETFDSFMMISCVIGLMDEETGFVYFLNFDHPKPLIITSKKESYFVDSKIYKKLGFPEENHSLQIHRFSLNFQDYWVLYSDGCIEIELQNKINENETIIQEMLLKTNEDLSNFLEVLQKTGSIKDDISLLKIQYLQKPNIKIQKENEEIALDENTKLKIEKSLFQYLKERKYKEITYLLSKFLEVYPYNDDLLYYLSYSYRKLKQWNLAIETGERLLNFNMLYKKNYLNLIFCYYKISNSSRIETLKIEFKKHFSDQSKSLESRLNKFFKTL
ncbi:MAG: SpoIIE family protein phosphatase [Leptonema sp. (in: bacteria)]